MGLLLEPDGELFKVVCRFHQLGFLDLDSSSSSSLTSSSSHSHVTLLKCCDKIKLSNLLLPRKSGTIKSLQILSTLGTLWDLGTAFLEMHLREGGAVVSVWGLGARGASRSFQLTGSGPRPFTLHPAPDTLLPKLQALSPTP